jgi:hypothetical protein
MHEAKRQLNLLGKLVSSKVVQEELYWTTLRGGYYLSVSKSLVHGTYKWDVGLHGNVCALSKEGSGTSLDDCMRTAHLAIAYYLREVEAVHEFVLRPECPPEVTSRYRRDPVI